MIKRIIFATLIPLSLYAQESKPITTGIGCFVENYAGNNCSQKIATCEFNDNDYYNFGFTVANLCARYGSVIAINIAEMKRAETNASLANTCYADLANSNAQWTASYNAYLKQKSLATKLKKACGLKCKRIK